MLTPSLFNSYVDTDQNQKNYEETSRFENFFTTSVD